jgi:hypothetical protein
VSLANLGRALNGGVNDNQFPRWLDENLFDGATFDAFSEGRPPRTAPERQTALVTGSTAGIGLEIARKLAVEDASAT